jgi:hypothetical protein
MNLIPKRKLGETGVDNMSLDMWNIPKAIIGSAKIQDATITNAKIADLAVTSGKIGDLAVTSSKINDCSITKLTAGNLTVTGTLTTGKWVTGAAGTNRIEIDANYVAGYNAANTLQFYLSAADGKAYAAGGGVILDASGITINGDNLKALMFSYSSSEVCSIYYKRTTGEFIIQTTADTKDISLNSTRQIYLSANAGAGDIITHGDIIPLDDVTDDLGSSSKKMNSVYAQNHIIAAQGSAETITGNIAYVDFMGTHGFVCYIDGGWAAVELTH